MCYLPSYINELLLLLNSGMVLNEAMVFIALNYKKLESKKINLFVKDYCKLYDEACKSGISMVLAFDQYGQKKQIKELSRISKIIADGEKKGIDLWQKLAEENKILWDERKRMALEHIRLSESKMSFPLGLLLMALIIITAAPAMMQMNIS